MKNNTTNAYQAASILTADPGKLIVMCYEKAIFHLSNAVKHYENKEYEAKAKDLQKAIDVITELNSCLNIEKGGDIARNLDALYRYMITTILESDLKRNIGDLKQVIDMLKELDEAWRTILVRSKKPAVLGQVVPAAFTSQPAMATASIGRTWSA